MITKEKKMSCYVKLNKLQKAATLTHCRSGRWRDQTEITHQSPNWNNQNPKNFSPLRANACSQFLFGKFVDIFLPASFLVHHSPAVLLAALTSPWQEQIQRPSPLHPARMRSLQLKVEWHCQKTTKVFCPWLCPSWIRRLLWKLVNYRRGGWPFFFFLIMVSFPDIC